MPEHYRFVAKHLKKPPQAVYVCRAKVGVFTGSGTWYYATLPPRVSATIKKRHGAHARGWGSHRVKAELGKTTWETSIFPYKGAYIILLKAAVRKKESVRTGALLRLRLTLS